MHQIFLLLIALHNFLLVDAKEYTWFDNDRPNNELATGYDENNQLNARWYIDLDEFAHSIFNHPVDDSKGVIYLLWFFAVIFFTITFLFFIFILLSRVFDNINTRKRKILEKKAQEIITSYLFERQLWNYKRLTLFSKKYLRTKFQREIFLQTLISLKTNIIGQTGDTLQELYTGLRLHRRSLEKLNSRYWHIAARGIVELSEMDMKNYLPQIRMFINHKNPTLRAQAQIALIQLEGENPFDFLDHLDQPLHEWHQVELAHVSEQLNKSALPDFTRWLNHREESIVIFCLRMISLHNQFNASEKLLKMLKNPATSEKVRSALIFAVGQLEMYEATDILKMMFFTETNSIKQEIVNTLGILNRERIDVVLNRMMKEEKKYLGRFYMNTTVFIPKGDSQLKRPLEVVQ